MFVLSARKPRRTTSSPRRAMSSIERSGGTPMSDALRARRPAVRPVHELALAHRSSEELVDRNPEGLGLDVPERQLHARDRLGRDAARALAGCAVEIPVAHLDGTRILAEEDGLEIVDRRHHTVGIPSVRALAVARDPGVGAHGDELPGAPPGVDDEGLDPGDLHLRTPPADWPAIRCRRPRGAARSRA